MLNSVSGELNPPSPSYSQITSSWRELCAPLSCLARPATLEEGYGGFNDVMLRTMSYVASVKCACGLGLPKRGAWGVGGCHGYQFCSFSGPRAGPRAFLMSKEAHRGIGIPDLPQPFNGADALFPACFFCFSLSISGSVPRESLLRRICSLRSLCVSLYPTPLRGVLSPKP